MSIYLIPIETAIVLFPVLAALFTIPYIIIQYRRYGAITPLRVVLVYSFIFYLLCAYFLVILPLPPMEEVAKYTSPTMQLIPFESLREFSVSTSLVINDPSTYFTALNEPSLFLILFNILLTLPFGIYLRYYFQCSWKKTLLLTFLLTLSFECIQLSALFGIYPRPYRIFDVDDLITNTIGGMLGYLIAPVFSRFLPSRATLDENALTKGKQVSALRRCSAFFIDLSIVAVLTALTLIILFIFNSITLASLSLAAILVYIFYVLVCIILISIVTKGKTLGKAIVNIRLVQREDTPIRWYHNILHYGIPYIFVLPCPYIILQSLIHYLDMRGYLSFDIFIIAFLCLFYVFSLIQALHSLLRKGTATWYDRHWKLHNISTIGHVVHSKEIIEKEEVTKTDSNELL